MARPVQSGLLSGQDIRYCTSIDGARLAYATTGEGFPLVRTAHWLTHLEFDLQSPLRSGLIRDLSRHHQFVRYDERGTGLSDRSLSEITFEAMVDDLEAVVDALALERFALLGISQGGPVAITYAVRHPEQISHLVLYGTYARGRMQRDDADEKRGLFEASRTLIREGWGSENPSFRQFFTLQYIPDATPEHLRSYTEMQRVSATPEMAERIFLTTSNINVMHLLPQIRTPALVMHRRGDKSRRFNTARNSQASSQEPVSFRWRAPTILLSRASPPIAHSCVRPRPFSAIRPSMRQNQRRCQ